jgi:uncharacterized repeat protein (TIGR01451 family)
MARKLVIAILLTFVWISTASHALAQSEPKPESSGGGEPGRPSSIEPTPGSIDPEPAPSLFISATRMRVGDREVDAAPPGDRVELQITLSNQTDRTFRDVSGVLSAEVEGVHVTQKGGAFGDIAPGKEADASFAFTHDAKPCSEKLAFSLALSTGETQSLGVPGDCPGPRLFVENVEYGGGDGDDIPEPGETVSVTVTLRNEGRDPANDVRGTLTTSSNDVTVTRGTTSWNDIAPGSSARNNEDLVIKIADDAPRQETQCQGVSDGDGSVSSDTDVQIAPAGEATAEPAETITAEPAVVEPAPSSEATTEPEPQPVPPPGQTTVEPAPQPVPPDEKTVEPEPEPSPQDAPARIEARLNVAASGQTFELFVDNGIACMAFAAEGAPETAGAAGVARDSAPPSEGHGGAAFPIAVSALVSAAALVIRRFAA